MISFLRTVLDFKSLNYKIILISRLIGERATLNILNLERFIYLERKISLAEKIEIYNAGIISRLTVAEIKSCILFFEYFLRRAIA